MPEIQPGTASVPRTLLETLYTATDICLPSNADEWSAGYAAALIDIRSILNRDAP